MMNMMGQPLRYRISQWPQAAKCLSNNSRNLYISINNLVQNDTLTGMLIKVEHTEFGTLFAAMIRGQGRIVTQYDDSGNYIPWMTTPEILVQLRKFGFDITYNQISSLSDDILNKLMQVRDLGYDKINKIVVVSRKDGLRINKSYIIALKTKGNEDLLVYGLPITEVKFNNRLAAGKIISLNESDFDWEWVDAIYNIDDILQENADVEKFEASESQEAPVMMEHPAMEVPEGFTLYDETDQEV